MHALLDTIAQIELPLDAQRIFHGRGGLFPGCEHWALDAFPPVWLLTSFQPATDAELASVDAALRARLHQLAPQQPLNWVYQCRYKGQTETRLMAGVVPTPHVVTEDDSRYLVPKVFGQYSTAKVLATEYIEGVRADSDAVQALSQERRNRIGASFLSLYLRELLDVQTMQTDPHLGNYLIKIDPEDQTGDGDESWKATY